MRFFSWLPRQPSRSFRRPTESSLVPSSVTARRPRLTRRGRLRRRVRSDVTKYGSGKRQEQRKRPRLSEVYRNRESRLAPGTNCATEIKARIVSHRDGCRACRSYGFTAISPRRDNATSKLHIPGVEVIYRSKSIVSFREEGGPPPNGTIPASDSNRRETIASCAIVSSVPPIKRKNAHVHVRARLSNSVPPSSRPGSHNYHPSFPTPPSRAGRYRAFNDRRCARLGSRFAMARGEIVH